MNEVDKIKDIGKVFNYWIASSDKDYNVMVDLYQSKNYSWALFLGHIVIEKLFSKKYRVPRPIYS